jgi:drug/metabolite transporter (DMT)-like permease
MNTFKVMVATAFLLLICPWIGGFDKISMLTLISLVTSGFIGLVIGDLFLLQAFFKLGPSRTLMLFGFQPLIIGTLNWILFSQTLKATQLYAVFFLIGSLVIFSLESKKSTGTWNVRGLGFALIGVALDAVGVVLTRYGFNDSPDFHVLNGHFIRCSGALFGFFLIHIFFKKIHILKKFQTLNLKSKFQVTMGSFLGTFVSLCFYLTAIKLGNIATLSSVAITGPLFAGLFECLHQKKWPSKEVLMATFLFICGFYILVGN